MASITARDRTIGHTTYQKSVRGNEIGLHHPKISSSPDCFIRYQCKKLNKLHYTVYRSVSYQMNRKVESSGTRGTEAG